ncbi:MAG TPA: type II toxin-antitoxin system VapC family toxin [Rhizobiaceae bacterium]|nr:type II toxin-antitoxin system VapC family toxin [Rhizobiaceae bacterium]
MLVRMATRDDSGQASMAFAIVSKAETVAVPIPALLEFVWVLKSVYLFSREEIAEALRSLIDLETVVTDRHAIEIGLRVYSAGGDSADGVIAASGVAMGGETFVSFDRKAVKRVSESGIAALDARELA